MDQLADIIKPVGIALGAVAPFLRSFLGQMANQPRHLDERYGRLKAFFEEGATGRHPMLVEAAFAKAVGHEKLDSIEIGLILRQRRPTEFMRHYLRAHAHMRPTEVGDQFELRGPAKRLWLRRTLVALGALVYALLVAPSFSMLFYVIPPLAASLDWANLFGAIGLSSLGFAAAAAALMGASRLLKAAQLVELQVAANNEPERDLKPISMEVAPAVTALAVPATAVLAVEADSARSVETA